MDITQLPALCGKHLRRVRDVWGSSLSEADKDRGVQNILAEAASCRVCSEVRTQHERERQWRLHPDPRIFPRGRQVGRIPEAVWKDLRGFPRASEHTYPCAVETVDGTYWPRVLFAEKEAYHGHFEGTYGMEEPFI
ncbi:MAG TPA: hypothetical protein VEY12_08070, partial [Thermoplasmata archaeon]|nr:hypothetical protein [Thermoplasmata archaeon]